MASGFDHSSHCLKAGQGFTLQEISHLPKATQPRSGGPTRAFSPLLQVSPDTGWSQACTLSIIRPLLRARAPTTKAVGEEKLFGLLVKKARERG